MTSKSEARGGGSLADYLAVEAIRERDEALTGRAIAEAREGELRRKLGEVQAEIVLLSSDMAQDDNEQLCRVLDGIANGIEGSLAAPAPEPGGLLALVRELEAERQEAIKANHEPLSRGEDFHRKATARYIAVDCFLGRLRAAIGLPPVETGGTA